MIHIKNIIYLAVLVAIVSCTSQKTKESISSGDELSYNEIRDDYMASNYVNNALVIDTSLLCGKDKYRFTLYANSLFDSTIRIPEKYNWGNSSVFITHNKEYTLEITKNDNLIKREKIDNSVFKQTVDEAIQNYGVLLYPDMEVSCDKVGLSFSYSIPLTDVGMEIDREIEF